MTAEKNTMTLNGLPAVTIADAICDRLLHNAHKIHRKGESRRKEKEARS